MRRTVLSVCNHDTYIADGTYGSVEGTLYRIANLKPSITELQAFQKFIELEIGKTPPDGAIKAESITEDIQNEFPSLAPYARQILPWLGERGTKALDFGIKLFITTLIMQSQLNLDLDEQIESVIRENREQFKIILEGRDQPPEQEQDTPSDDEPVDDNPRPLNNHDDDHAPQA